jgi:hypothetical protein
VQYRLYQNRRICLLCAEDTPERCHRRLLGEKIVREYDGVTVTHLQTLRMAANR